MMRVVLEEKSLREGLQAESRLFGLAEKVEIVRLLALAGVRRLQLGSFVNPRSVPQVANTDVLASLVRKEFPDILCTALVFNDKGLDRAARSGLDHLSVSVSATDTNSRLHTGRPVAEVMETVLRLIARAVAGGIKIQAEVQCAFGCANEGAVAETAVLAAVGQLVVAGAAAINLIDTSGMAHPLQVKRLATNVRQAYPDIELSLHLHDTLGLGLVNMYAGYEAGVRVFDVAAGGLGGGVQGEGPPDNVATEDAVHLFEGMGIDTGIDLARFCQVVDHFETLLARQLPGRMNRVLQRGQLPLSPAGEYGSGGHAGGTISC
jgi:hydroxymethylglutaryl-CoA lyase